MKTTVLRFVKYFIFACIISLPIMLPYFHKGYFPTHDGEWSVVRLGDMYRTVRDLQVPARYSGHLNFGYGYPLFNFVYPFPYYLGLIPLFMGLGFVASIKLLFLLSVPFSCFFMFLLGRELWKDNLSGAASAILYTYLPYRFVDLYVRGSLGESLSLALFPLIFYLAVRLIRKPDSKILPVLIGVSYAGLIMTHNIMAILFTGVFVLFLIGAFLIEQKKILKPFLLSFLIALVLSLFFWLPALVEKHNILLSKIPIADRNLYFVHLNQLIFPKWGFEPPTAKNGFSYQIGWPHLLLLAITYILLCYEWLKKFRSRRFSLTIQTVLLIIILILTFLMFKESSFFWGLPLLSEINYPWTLLAPIGFLISLLCGYLLTKGTYVKNLGFFLVIIAVVEFLPLAKPQVYFDKGDTYYLSNDATTTSSNELMPLWVKDQPKSRVTDKVQIVTGKAKVENLTISSKKVTFTAQVLTPSRLRINTIYYPGWSIVVDQRQKTFSYSNDKGVMEFQLSPGMHTVTANFTETPLRLVSNIISLLGWGIVLLLLVKWSFLYKKPEK